MNSTFPVSARVPLRKYRNGHLRVLVLMIIGTLLVGVAQSLAGAQSTTVAFMGTNRVSLALGLCWLAWMTVASMKRPEYVVCCMFFFTFFSAWRPINLIVGSFLPSQLLAIAVVTGVSLSWLLRRKIALAHYFWLPMPILLLVVIVAISTILTMYVDLKSTTGMAIIRTGRSDPLTRAVTSLAALLIGIFGYYAARSALNSRELILLSVRTWIAGAAFSAIVGFYLLIKHYFSFLPDMPISAMLGTAGSGLIGRDAAALSLGSGLGSEMVMRMAAFAMEPRHLTYLFAPLLAYLFVYLLLNSWKNRRETIGTFAATMIVLAGFTLTTSRSTYIIAVILVVIVLWTTRSKLFSSISVAVGILSFIFAAIAIAGLLITFISGYNPVEFILMQLHSLTQVHVTSSGVVYAMDGFSVAWEMFKESPLLGKGWGSYVYFTTAFYSLFYAQQANPNNLYLLMMGETGILGLLALLWVFWYGLTTTKKRLTGSSEALYRPMLSGIGAALLATYACFMIWDTIHYTHLWMLIGLAEATRNSAERDGN